jgi:hypothetical protein
MSRGAAEGFVCLFVGSKSWLAGWLVGCCGCLAFTFALHFWRPSTRKKTVYSRGRTEVTNSRLHLNLNWPARRHRDTVTPLRAMCLRVRLRVACVVQLGDPSSHKSLTRVPWYSVPSTEYDCSQPPAPIKLHMMSINQQNQK